MRASALNIAGPTGLEPATSSVTGRRSNQLSYDPKTNSGLERARTSDLCNVNATL